ncbi:MAG: hypothetical protein Q8881_02215 [Sweet potato little leaf phytoplasma]|nr:hypothetical protein [Sweet potato little leaf phytoplasma]
MSSKSKHSSSNLSDSMVSDERGKMWKDGTRTSSKDDERNYKSSRHYVDESSDREKRRKTYHRHSKFREESPSSFSYSRGARDEDNMTKKDYNRSQRGEHSFDPQSNTNINNKKRESSRRSNEGKYDPSSREGRNDSHYKRRTAAPMLSEEERAARLREMQADAELHEEQRWKRLRKAEDEDARETNNETKLRGNNFLDAAKKSVYGAEKGGSSTIEESVRRRTYYSQGRSEATDVNAFRR